MQQFNFGSFRTHVRAASPSSLFDSISESAVIVCDTNTRQFAPPGREVVELPAGEQHKSWEYLHHVLGVLLEKGLTRASTVVGLGGGVITDLSACAASLYMRGCRLVLVPTSLLAMVDAALGGKTGVNFGGYKNMVGTFYPAHELILAPDLVRTLPEREYRSGLAEVIKSALLGDLELLALLETEVDSVLARDSALTERCVHACVAVKGRIVETDLRESGVRAHLNLGHTFAHALETVTGFGTYTHGEAVAWGLARAAQLSVLEGYAEQAYAEQVSVLLSRYGYDTTVRPELASDLIAAMQRDKKRTGAEVQFVLQRAAGETLVTSVEAENLTAVLAE
jgi:3-dehydroquinate synthase